LKGLAAGELLFDDGGGFSDLGYTRRRDLTRGLVVLYSLERHRKDASDCERRLKVSKLLSGKKEASPAKFIFKGGIRHFLRSAERGKVVLDQTKVEQDKY